MCPYFTAPGSVIYVQANFFGGGEWDATGWIHTSILSDKGPHFSTVFISLSVVPFITCRSYLNLQRVQCVGKILSQAADEMDTSNSY